MLAAMLLFSSFIRSQANVKIPLAKRCDDCQSRNISYCTCCFANRDRGGRFVRVVYEEILASLEATSTENGSAKRVTTAI